jgi:hypothetical protein
MIRFALFFLLQIALFAADFDCILIGSSPFSLCEALYQAHSGKKVLILEEAIECGGAWRSIEACGIPYADLGCHQVGGDMKLKAFLEEYVGCKIVSLDNPLLPFESNKGSNGWYFSKGCFELVDHLLQLAAMADITLYTNCKAEKVSIDTSNKSVTVFTKEQTFTANKLIVTPMSCLSLNPQAPAYNKSKHYHLYLLVQDPTEPHFSYQNGISGASRMMNLTHFVSLTGTGRQLIVIQTHNEQSLSNAESFIKAMKEKKLLDPSAYILKQDTYIYEAGSFNQTQISQLGAKDLVEILQTGHINGLTNYISKWKSVMKPYKDSFK